MSLTLREIESLIAALGVNIPQAILVQRAKAEDYAARREKIIAEAATKAADWPLKGSFDDALSRAAESATQTQFDDALKLLDEAETILVQPDPPPPPVVEQTPSAPPTTQSNVRFAQLRLEWDAQKKAVASQLDDLRRSILAEFNDPESASATTKLDKVLAHFSSGLSDSLDGLYNAADAASQKQLREKSLALTTQYLAYVQTDPLISHIEANPFIPVTVRDTLAGPLQAIQTALQDTIS